MKSLNKKQKKWLIRILIGAFLLIIAVVLEHIFDLEEYTGKFVLLVYLPSYFVAGGDVLKKAAGNIIKGQLFDENFLMSLATVGAFGVGEYHEAVVVMIFYQVGELFQNCAVAKSRNSIKNLMELSPECANIVIDDEIKEIAADEVEVGSVIVVKAGERIPLDGVVKSGATEVDTSPLTGESYPKDIGKGDKVYSGCINLSGTIYVETVKLAGDSISAKILELVENATEKKAKKENFITRFARYYTPFVVVAAVLLAFVPPITGHGTFASWISRSLIFLVISCPCALVISIPMGFFAGIGNASSKGILVKGGNALEELSKIDAVAFDKTGTVTTGDFVVSKIVSEKYDEDELLHFAAMAEVWSNHPISKSIATFAKNKNIYEEFDKPEELKELSGLGVYAKTHDGDILVGNKRLMAKYGINVPDEIFITGVYVSVDMEYAGYIELEDRIKENAVSAIKELKNQGVKNTVMLTGDRSEVAKKVADTVGIDQVYSKMLPEDKVKKVEDLMNNFKVAFVGDGINDTPVLARADVGIAMGGMGSDAAIEAADVIIMDDNIENISGAIRIGKKTLRIVNENIVFALGCKGVIMVLGALGIANIWAAVFADVGVAVIAILNSMRALTK